MFFERSHGFVRTYVPGRYRFALAVATALHFGPAQADDGFPFGTEMQLDVGRQPGSKRIPNLEIGDAGEVVLELWCKGGKGQFSVAGNTVIFVAGAMENRPCPPDRAQADDELIAALTDAAHLEAAGRFRAVRRREDAAVSHQHKLGRKPRKSEARPTSLWFAFRPQL